jgi:hypothetical protein
MMLTALARPPAAKAVNRMASGIHCSAQSSGAKPVFCMAMPVIQHASTPLAMVASSRVVMPTVLVKSSARPNAKAGMPATSMGPRMAPHIRPAGQVGHQQADGHHHAADACGVVVVDFLYTKNAVTTEVTVHMVCAHNENTSETARRNDRQKANDGHHSHSCLTRHVGHFGFPPANLI